MADADNNNAPAAAAGSASATTPLLSLLDSVLSQDETQVRSIVGKILDHLHRSGCPFHDPFYLGVPAALSEDTLVAPLHSTERLCRLIQVLYIYFPHFVRTPSAYDGSLPLHFAASLGQPAVARLLLEQYPAAATTPNDKGKIPLHYAAREGRGDMVRFFLSLVPQTATIQSQKRKLALHFAAGDGHVQIVRDLLTVYPAGASLPSKKGKLPLHFGARWGHLQIARDLLAVYPAAVRALDWEGSLPLHDAAREGQYEMARHLVESKAGFAPALATANLRGEIPLFPAVRSGNVDLIAFLLQAWPVGGKYVLQNLTADDNVVDWSILELLLRGAAGCLRPNGPLLAGRTPPAVCLSSEMGIIALDAAALSTADGAGETTTTTTTTTAAAATLQPAATRKKKKLKTNSSWSSNDTPRLMTTTPFGTAAVTTTTTTTTTTTGNATTTTTAAFNLQQQWRKSPILDKSYTNSRKRPRTSSSSSSCCDDDDEEDSVSQADSDGQHEGKQQLPATRLRRRREFLPLHAALECGASAHVLKLVLEQVQTKSSDDSDDDDDDVQYLKRRDEYGRLPLHWAMTQCSSSTTSSDAASTNSSNGGSNSTANDDVIQFVLDELITPQAAACRDNLKQQLPLHIAIACQADVRVISALLEAYPEAGVEKCRSTDQWYNKTPLDMCIAMQNDLSTVYRLLRVDPSYVRPDHYNHRA